MIFSANQISSIVGVLDKYLLTFAAHHIGVKGLSSHEISKLKKFGIDSSKINANTSNVTQAFKLGLLSDALGDSATKNMSYDQFLKYLSSGKMIKLNALENAALENLQIQTFKDVLKLGNKIKDDISTKLVFANKATNTVKHNSLITTAAKKAIEERKGIQSVISDIGHMTEKWDQDFGRIADYTLHTAFDEGRATNIAKMDGPNALVYKDVYAGACKHCIKAYLKGGIKSEPKLFTVNELQTNATNVGRKVNDWLPVIGPLHPWCRCTLMRVPRGFTIQDYNNKLWIWNGSDFVRDLQKIKRKVKRTSKVRVTVNGQTTEI